MAYIKYKELTRYFNFNKKVELEEMPSYVEQYIDKSEKILTAYKVQRDIIVITNQKIVIFDVRGLFTDNRKIHILPYVAISSSAIEFKGSTVGVYLVMDSGYQLKLNFVNMTAEKKTDLRIAFVEMMAHVSEKVK